MARQRQHWEPDEVSGGFLDRVMEALEGEHLRDFWPVTLRGIHYVLLDFERFQTGMSIVKDPRTGKPKVDPKTGKQIRVPAYYDNTPRSYAALSDIVTKGRLSGRIPWDAVSDQHRKMHDNGGGFSGSDDFIEQEKDRFLKGYHRDLISSQPVVLEVWIEKDTVSRYVNDIAAEYQLRTVIARGYGSVSFVHDLRQRVRETAHENKTTRILYFGDLDPSGVNMLDAMFITLFDEMGVDKDDVDFERCAITPAQVGRYKLKSNPDALKDDEWQRTRGDPKKTKGDSRAEVYKDEYGKVSVELDALGPERLQKLVREAIERNLDMKLFRKEQKAEEADEKRIRELREKVEDMIQDV